MDTLKKEESIQSSVKDINSKVGETIGQFFGDKNKERRMSKEQFEKVAIQRRISKQITTKISASFNGTASALKKKDKKAQIDSEESVKEEPK